MRIPDLANETLYAYFDGDLDAAQHAEVETLLATSPELQKRVETIQQREHTVRAALHAVVDELPDMPAPALDAIARKAMRKRRLLLAVSVFAVVVATILTVLLIGMLVGTPMSTVGGSDTRTNGQSVSATREAPTPPGSGDSMTFLFGIGISIIMMRWLLNTRPPPDQSSPTPIEMTTTPSQGNGHLPLIAIAAMILVLIAILR